MSNESKTLNVRGMSCMHCVNSVKKSVGALNGVSKVDVDLGGQKVTVVYDSEFIDLEAIEKTIENSGYEVV